uniref:GP30 protein n=1 Tax=Cardioderma bat herpesvirus TaxID=3141914 RepID=A0AAU7E1V4_9VIRU
MITCDGAFNIYGLNFEDDSLIWSVLTNGYLEIDKSICGPAMRFSAFLDKLSGVRFSEGIPEKTKRFSTLFGLCHYVSAYYGKFHKKRNTLVGYMRLLAKVANSLFCQLVYLRRLGEHHRNENLKTAFDLLENPLELGERGLFTAYVNDELYVSYSGNLAFVSNVLCGCAECMGYVPRALLERVPRLRSGAARRRPSTRLCRYVPLLRDTSLTMYPPDIRHLDAVQVELLVRELSNDLMQRYMYDSVDAGCLPLNLGYECEGKGFLERMTLHLVYNVTFVLFLISCVRKALSYEMELCCKTLKELMTEICEAPWVFRGKPYLRFLLLRGFTAEELPGVACIVLSRFKRLHKTPDRLGFNQEKALIEHLCGRSKGFGRRNRELMLAHRLRHVILSEYGVVNFSGIYSDPEVFRLTDTVLYAVSGLFIFKASLWFNISLQNIVAVAATYGRRRRRLASVRIRPARDRTDEGPLDENYQEP